MKKETFPQNDFFSGEITFYLRNVFSGEMSFTGEMFFSRKFDFHNISFSSIFFYERLVFIRPCNFIYSACTVLCTFYTVRFVQYVMYVHKDTTK